MNISKVAKLTGISAKMIRYYEDIELISNIQRTATGYRDYHPQDIKRLQFIYNARQLGFPLDVIKELLCLWQDEKRQSANVKHIAEQHVNMLNQKIIQMQSMVDMLQVLIKNCAGNQDTHCAILDKIESNHQNS